MAPEQVLGESVDHRADIFALGAVLYEMFTGARAFHRPSSLETMTAVVQSEPADPLTLKPNLPPAAAAVVGRCLEKNREERFQSARDLAFDLQQPRDLPTASGALWLFRRGEVPAHVFQMDIATGRRRLWKTLSPPDAAGVYSILDFQVTPTGRSYFYSYSRLLSQLYVVRSLH